LSGLTAPFESEKNKITRVTFNSAVKPLLEIFSDREHDEIFGILNNYLTAVTAAITKKTTERLLGKPAVFRAFMGLFPAVAQRMQDRYSGDYSSGNFAEVLEPVFSNIPLRRLASPGTSWVSLREYLEKRLRSKLTL
jgi:hypothetical protein